jgi:hypothetical protein
VGGVGNENFAARIALRFVPGANQQDASKFAVRAGRRLQRDGVHAGNFEQASLQEVDDFKNPLGEGVRPVRMGFS